MITMMKTTSRVALAGLLSAVVLASPTPALAANDRLLVSNDGVNFVPESTFPLFASMGRVVPGDSRTEHVWVMNNSSSAALLRVDMVDPIADDAYLAAAFSLNVFPTGGTRSASVTIAQGIDNGACTVLDAGISLGAGERLRLDITADVDAALAAQQGALGTVGFQLRGLLTEAVAGGHGSTGSKCIAPAPRCAERRSHEHRRWRAALARRHCRGSDTGGNCLRSARLASSARRKRNGILS